MKKLMPWIIALAALPLLAQDLTGTWQGLISAGRDLRIVMKISKADGDGLKAVMYSIDQGPQGMASSAFTVLGSSITISIAAVAGTYEGKLNAEGTSIAGAFTHDPAEQA